MTLYALLFILSAIGISETVYLIRKRKNQERPVCFLGEDCQKVLESKHNKILGIHNDILGLLFYIAISFITVFLLIEMGSQILWIILAKIMILGGLIMSFYLVYLQWRIIKAWCFWCLISTITTFLMAIIILFV